MQGLYEHFQQENADLAKGEKKLKSSIHDIFELFLYELKALALIHQFAEEQIEQKRNRKLPSKEDLDPNLRFVQNRFLKWLNSSQVIDVEWENNNIKWGDERDFIKSVWRDFQETEAYKEYMAEDEVDLKADVKLAKQLYGLCFAYDERFHQYYEERDLHWADDLDAAQMLVVKTMRRFSEETNAMTPLVPLLKNEEDMEFATRLFRKAIVSSHKLEDQIKDKAKNWEMDRIALLDIILMKMGITEMVEFHDIPVKVTLNEYIELSKEYSTPKSGNFINGILDKVRYELEGSGEIRKIGRGLL
jgi:N utilization substance protein B